MSFQYFMSKTETAEWKRNGLCECRPWQCPVFWIGAEMKDSPPAPFRKARDVIAERAMREARAAGVSRADIFTTSGNVICSVSTDSSIPHKTA